MWIIINNYERNQQYTFDNYEEALEEYNIMLENVKPYLSEHPYETGGILLAKIEKKFES